ncbi:hypothetical protein BCR34DRAFT_593888 [Clohesyomyces aquaticus]|uniref:Uncharacterized protein n=1 Tax=Clohesyomyces aquaticus TaxID=1231657 RepID=A0A1Y1YEB8_9PLEO|nr:hypothetical protein BCR34DRAFT_593888 [Clohesyomyces aquaticus]
MAWRVQCLMSAAVAALWLAGGNLGLARVQGQEAGCETFGLTTDDAAQESKQDGGEVSVSGEERGRTALSLSWASKLHTARFRRRTNSVQAQGRLLHPAALHLHAVCTDAEWRSGNVQRCRGAGAGAGVCEGPSHDLTPPDLYGPPSATSAFCKLTEGVEGYAALRNPPVFLVPRGHGPHVSPTHRWAPSTCVFPCRLSACSFPHPLTLTAFTGPQKKVRLMQLLCFRNGRLTSSPMPVIRISAPRIVGGRNGDVVRQTRRCV